MPLKQNHPPASVESSATDFSSIMFTVGGIISWPHCHSLGILCTNSSAVQGISGLTTRRWSDFEAQGRRWDGILKAFPNFYISNLVKPGSKRTLQQTQAPLIKRTPKVEIVLKERFSLKHLKATNRRNWVKCRLKQTQPPLIKCTPMVEIVLKERCSLKRHERNQ